MVDEVKKRLEEILSGLPVKIATEDDENLADVYIKYIDAKSSEHQNFCVKEYSEEGPFNEESWKGVYGNLEDRWKKGEFNVIGTHTDHSVFDFLSLEIDVIKTPEDLRKHLDKFKNDFKEYLGAEAHYTLQINAEVQYQDGEPKLETDASKWTLN